jgi:hypothetical protein
VVVSGLGVFHFADEMKHQSLGTSAARFFSDTMPCPNNRNITLDDELIYKQMLNGA